MAVFADGRLGWWFSLSHRIAAEQCAHGRRQPGEGSVSRSVGFRESGGRCYQREAVVAAYLPDRFASGVENSARLLTPFSLLQEAGLVVAKNGKVV